MEKYKIGTIFCLYENDPQQYVIINAMEKENNTYLLVAPFDNKEKIKVEYEKVILLNVDKKTEDVEYEANEDIIIEMVDDTIKKAEQQKN